MVAVTANSWATQRIKRVVGYLFSQGNQLSTRSRQTETGLRYVSFIGKVAKHCQTLILTGPGTNPLVVSPAVAYLWTPVVKVSNSTARNAKASQQKFTYQYTTLVKIEDTKSGISASRIVDSLFADSESSTEAISYCCFAAIVGKASECYDVYPKSCPARSIYLFSAGAHGLHLARVSLSDIAKSKAYEFYHPSSCTFSTFSTSPSQSPSPYLPGSYSTGTILYSPFLSTFILIYMTALADSTLYLRYLDLSRPICNNSIWPANSSITANDAAALTRYAWSDPQVLYHTPKSTLFNYAGMAHPAFFNTQYYQDWMYSNGGIDSVMRSPWVGSEVVSEKEAGGDGKYLMVSWVTHGQGESGSVYDIVMARVELSKGEENAAETVRSGNRVITVAAACICVLMRASLL
jgi:hypothetical protein